MPIDTTSYYPEVPRPDGDKEESLNKSHTSLFGDKVVEESETSNVEKNSEGSKTFIPHHPTTEPEKTILDKLANAVSHFLSWVLVPLLMPVFGIIFIFRLSILDVIPAGLQIAVIFVIAGINFFAPMLLILLLKILGVVKDVGLNGRKERLVPYIITVLCYAGSAWFVTSRGAPIWVAMFFWGGAVAAFLNLLINLKWKISAHAAAIAGIIALLIKMQRDSAVEPQLFVWLLITVGAAGLLGSARIWLGRHTVWQVLAGYLVGFCSVFFIMFIR